MCVSSVCSVSGPAGTTLVADEYKAGLGVSPEGGRYREVVENVGDREVVDTVGDTEVVDTVGALGRLWTLWEM